MRLLVTRISQGVVNRACEINVVCQEDGDAFTVRHGSQQHGFGFMREVDVPQQQKQRIQPGLEAVDIRVVHGLLAVVVAQQRESANVQAQRISDAFARVLADERRRAVFIPRQDVTRRIGISVAAAWLRSTAEGGGMYGGSQILPDERIFRSKAQLGMRHGWNSFRKTKQPVETTAQNMGPDQRSSLLREVSQCR